MLGLQKILQQRSEIVRYQDRIRSLSNELAEIKARLPEIDQQVRIRPPKRSEDSRKMFLGRITLASEIPDLKQSPYSEALRVLEVEPMVMIHGRSSLEPLRLAVWALSDRKRMPAADYRVGEEHFFDVTPISKLPESLKRVQQFDSLPPTPSPGLLVEEEDSQTRLAFRHQFLSADQSKQVLVSPFPPPTSTHFSIYQTDLLPSINQIPAGGIRSYLQAEDLLQPAVSSVNAAASVISLANYLEAKGIRFLYGTLPSRWEVEIFEAFPDLPPDFPATPPRHEMLHHLSKAGVEVIDFTEILQTEHAGRVHGARPVIPPKGEPDPHLAPRASEIIANAISARIMRILPSPKDDKPIRFQLREATAKGEGHPFSIRQVVDSSGNPFQPQSDAKVLVCGDSNVYWWQSERATGAGISAHLAREISAPVGEISQANFRPHQMSNHLDEIESAKCVVFLQSSWVLWNTSSPHRLFDAP